MIYLKVYILLLVLINIQRIYFF